MLYSSLPKMLEAARGGVGYGLARGLRAGRGGAVRVGVRGGVARLVAGLGLGGLVWVVCGIYSWSSGKSCRCSARLSLLSESASLVSEKQENPLCSF